MVKQKKQKRVVNLVAQFHRQKKVRMGKSVGGQKADKGRLTSLAYGLKRKIARNLVCSPLWKYRQDNSTPRRHYFAFIYKNSYCFDHLNYFFKWYNSELKRILFKLIYSGLNKNCRLLNLLHFTTENFVRTFFFREIKNAIVFSHEASEIKFTNYIPTVILKL